MISIISSDLRPTISLSLYLSIYLSIYLSLYMSFLCFCVNSWNTVPLDKAHIHMHAHTHTHTHSLSVRVHAMADIAQSMRRAIRACYLLRSKSPRRVGRTYIGFTVNPSRRIRQHNGELVSGAKSTRSGRPWDMVMVVSGFHTKVRVCAHSCWRDTSRRVGTMTRRVQRRK